MADLAVFLRAPGSNQLPGTLCVAPQAPVVHDDVQHLNLHPVPSLSPRRAKLIGPPNLPPRNPIDYFLGLPRNRMRLALEKIFNRP